MSETWGPEPLVRLECWTGPWDAADPDANFKSDVALYSLADPLETLRGMHERTGVPIGALCRYVLARWATGGSEGALELGPSTVDRMWAACEQAETDDTDAARLRAYEQLREMLAWLRATIH
jgi:hypothetical protein